MLWTSVNAVIFKQDSRNLVISQWGGHWVCALVWDSKYSPLSKYIIPRCPQGIHSRTLEDSRILRILTSINWQSSDPPQLLVQHPLILSTDSRLVESADANEAHRYRRVTLYGKTEALKVSYTCICIYQPEQQQLKKKLLSVFCLGLLHGVISDSIT